MILYYQATLKNGLGTKNNRDTLRDFDTENHTENFCDTERVRKPHWKIFTKEITVMIQDYLTKIFSIAVQGHWNHTEKI